MEKAESEIFPNYSYVVCEKARENIMSRIGETNKGQQTLTVVLQVFGFLAAIAMVAIECVVVKEGTGLERLVFGLNLAFGLGETFCWVNILTGNDRERERERECVCVCVCV